MTPTIRPRRARVLTTVTLVLGTLGALAITDLAASATDAAFDPGRAPFQVRIRDDAMGYRIVPLLALPGEQVALSIESPATGARYHLEDGATSRPGPRWTWTAPTEVGHRSLRVIREGPADTVVVQAFVLRPATEIRDGRLEGYRIGSYPTGSRSKLPMNHPPRGYVELTPELHALPVSPHFTLGQFLCKQESGWPKYLVLRPRLLLKLERILEEINTAGLARADGLVVMSGYRTPFYNAAIGNVAYSRHQWGGAADIYVDVDGDGTMDDLNRDGVLDRKDADTLADLVERLSKRPWYSRLVGGLGRYDANEAHGPFVHVDVRGTRARW